MTSEEKKKILKMVEDGKINAEEAMKLIKALDESSSEIEIIEAGPGSSNAAEEGPKIEAPELDEMMRRAHRLWRIPLWIGVLITVGASFWLYTLVRAANFGFWFFCAWVPLLFGILLLVLFAGGSTSKWLYVKVEQSQTSWPRNIVFGLPLPLGLASWFLRNFGHHFADLEHSNVDQVIDLLSNGISPNAPLILKVDQGDGGERLKVYLG
jgi:hypothetical protein